VPDIVFVGRECRRLGEGAAIHNSGAATGDVVCPRVYRCRFKPERRFRFASGGPECDEPRQKKHDS